MKDKAFKTPDKKRARNRAYYHRNKERILEQHKEYKSKNKERTATWNADYRAANLDELRAKQREYYHENKEKRIAYGREYQKKQMECPEFRAVRSLRVRMANAIRRGDGKKTNKSVDLVGCTWNELRAHLESQFTEGMTWDNYGRHGWHIDHIKPCAKFDLTLDSDQKECFHYTNLQPLWAEDNLRKADKYDES